MNSTSPAHVVTVTNVSGVPIEMDGSVLVTITGTACDITVKTPGGMSAAVTADRFTYR